MTKKRVTIRYKANFMLPRAKGEYQEEKTWERVEIRCDPHAQQENSPLIRPGQMGL